MSSYLPPVGTPFQANEVGQTSANTNTLKEYDILSVQPTSDKALQLACTDLSNPGPNQVRIVPLLLALDFQDLARFPLYQG